MVARQGASLTVTALRTALDGRVAPGEVPAAFVLVGAVLRTANGKLDRRALPAPGRERPPLDHPLAPPRTPLERQLAELWADVLGLDAVGVHDDFLAFGEHSLLAGRLVARVHGALGAEVAVRSLLESPTVSHMAAAILTDRLRAEAGGEGSARIVEALGMKRPTRGVPPYIS